MGKIRVLIADDHAIVRMGLASLLGTSKAIEVIGEAIDGEDAVEKTVKLSPTVVVMDLIMPRRDGVAATAAILEKAPTTKILILTTFSSSDNISRALKAGAHGVILKSAGNDELLTAIMKLARGERYLPVDVERLLADDPPIPELSPRQLEILGTIAQGLTNKEISATLGISLESVKSHIKIILEKLGAASRAEAVAIAQRRKASFALPN